MTERKVNEYYDQDYFDWQRQHGEFGGKANTFQFLDSVKSTDIVLDFGCGGGFLLKNLNCAGRVGIEPNVNAHDQVKDNGCTVFSSPSLALQELGEESVDVIVSNNALEHCLNPYEELVSLYPLLKRGGVIHFCIPCDSYKWKYSAGDVNQHFFSWSPMNAGNLFTHAGYDVVFSRADIRKWPPLYRHLVKLGWPAFNCLSRLYGRIARSWFQIEIKAIKR